MATTIITVRRATLSDDDDDTDNENDDRSLGGASIPNLSISLVKSIVGSGVLALPAGLAGLGDMPTSVIPVAILLIAATGAMNAYFFNLIGRVCATTDAQTYAEAWDASVGSRHRPWVAAAVACKTVLSCLAFSMILADAGQAVAVGTLGWADVTREQALLVISGVALLPLSLLRDLSSLAPFSAVGVAGVALTAGVMIWRAVDGSYLAEEGEAAVVDGGAASFLSSVPTHLQPAFGDTGVSSADSSLHWLQALVLACTLATAFVAHYNAPRFRAELAQPTVPRYNLVVTIAFAISALFFVVVAVSGYLTFGTACDGFILNNYSPFDPLATVSRIALVLSVVMTFPLPFVGLRDGTLDLLQIPVDNRTDLVLNGLTVGLLTIITALAYVLHDLALVVAIGGGTFSTLVSSVFPAVMFASTAANAFDDTDAHAARKDGLVALQWESKFALILMTIAAGIGATGVWLALQKAM